MKPEAIPADTVDWPTLAPLLDDAVAGLSSTDREAILLRFYQQLPLAQVGQSLHISEDAAKKRVGRALDRLRRSLAAKGLTSTSSALGVTLLADVTHAAPQQLIHALTQTAAPAATQLAAATHKLILLAKLKTAAVIILLAGAATGVTAIVAPHFAASHPTTAPIAAKPPALASALIPLEEDESKVPGQIQLVRWDMVLNDKGESLILPALVPIDTPSKGFQAYRCNGLALRKAAAEALNAGGVERVAGEIEYGRVWGQQDQINLTFSWGNHLSSTPNAKVLMSFGDNNESTKTFTRTLGNRIKLALQHDVPRPMVQELVNDWQRREFPAAKVACDTELAPGDAIVFIGTFPAPSGRAYYGMAVWESFTAGKADMTRINAIRDAGWWCRFGPGKVRQWSNIATVWAQHGTPSTPAQLAPFTISLQDGKTARLVALTNPSRWPFCWWDPAGNPTTEFNGIVSFWNGELPKGVSAIIEIDGPAQEYVIASPTGHPDFNPESPYSEVVALAIPQTDATKHTLQTGILVGPWKELARMKATDKVTIGDTAYRTSRAGSFGDTSFLVQFDISGPLVDEDVLVAVGDGKQAWRGRGNLASLSPDKSTLSDQPNFSGIPLAKLEYFKLMRRKRQQITFTGIATEPKILPPAAATSEQARAAEKRLADRADQARLQALLDARKAWQQTLADPTTPKGALRAFANAILKNDPAAAESLLLASTPQAAAFGHNFVALMITHQQAYTIAAQRYGELAIHDNLAGRLSHLDDDFADIKIKSLSDGTADFGGLILRKNAAGQYRFDMDLFARDHAMEMNFQAQRLAEIIRLLNSNPTLTLDALKAALQRPLTTNPANEPPQPPAH